MQGKNEGTEALLQELDTLKEKDVTAEKLREKLSRFVNDLISHDFEKLVQLLYRLDIDEIKLKKTLKEHADQNAGDMIADLIIERQLQKIRDRQQFKQPDGKIDENERW